MKNSINAGIPSVDIRDAFFDMVYDFAAKDKNVIFITADTDAFSLRRYQKDFPGQFVNVGVAEQNMVAISSGLALCGKKVFIYAIIPFIALRCYEHIKVNICGMNLPITIIGASAGFSINYSGPTHHAVHDIAAMRILPEITILNPCDSTIAAVCAKIAYQTPTPIYVRLDKGKFPGFYADGDDFSLGFKVLKKPEEIAIISTGFMTQHAVVVAEILERKYSQKVGIIDLFRLKPINANLLLNTLRGVKQLVALEENCLSGGLGTILSEILIDNRVNIKLKRMAIPDCQSFKYGDRNWLHKEYGLDERNITRRILKERDWLLAQHQFDAEHITKRIREWMQ